MPGKPARHKPGQTCPTCEAVHRTPRAGNACVGHVRSTGRPCGNAPARGSSVCRYHGAGTKAARKAAEGRIAEQQWANLARKLIPDVADRTAITNPLETLLELASEANAFRESLRLLANELDGQIRYAAGGGTGEQLRAEVATYRQALKDTTDMLIAIARLDIEKMLARVTVRQAEQTLDSLAAGCDEAGLDDETKRKVIAGVGRHLRLVRRPAA